MTIDGGKSVQLHAAEWRAANQVPAMDGDQPTNERPAVRSTSPRPAASDMGATHVHLRGERPGQASTNGPSDERARQYARHGDGRRHRRRR